MIANGHCSTPKDKSISFEDIYWNKQSSLILFMIIGMCALQSLEEAIEYSHGKFLYFVNMYISLICVGFYLIIRFLRID